MSLLFFNINTYSDAYSNFSYQDYINGINEGWIEKNISYESILNLNNFSEDNYLNNNFNKFYSVKNFKDFEDFREINKDISVTTSTSLYFMARANVG